jgi:hypothetical protein
MEAVDKLCEPHSPAITGTAEISSNFLPECESGKCDFFRLVGRSGAVEVPYAAGP